jgi:hypothetical protein
VCAARRTAQAQGRAAALCDEPLGELDPDLGSEAGAEGPETSVPLSSGLAHATPARAAAPAATL